MTDGGARRGYGQRRHGRQGSDGRDRFGFPCGQVVSSRQQGAGDYVATCEDGNRYRVFVNAEGRVIVQTLD